MAITKIWAVKSSLSSVSGYIQNPEKTVLEFSEYEELHSDNSDISSSEPEMAVLVRGINCSPSICVSQFNLVKEQYDKKDGIQAYHGCISFAENEVQPKETIDIATEFVKRVWGDNFQVLIGCHTNTQHLHCHFLINSVSFVDGHRLHEEKAWFIFSKVADEICRNYGKSVIDSPERGKGGLTLREKKAKECLDNALENATSFPEFLSLLECEPCIPDISLSNKYWKITPLGWKVPVITDALGKKYTKDSLISNFDVSQEIEKFEYPLILKNPSLRGIQKDIARNTDALINEHKVTKPEYPSKLWLPHAIKNKVLSICKGLEELVRKAIVSFPAFINYFNNLSESLLRLRKKKMSYITEDASQKEIEAFNSEIRSVADIVASFESISSILDGSFLKKELSKENVTLENIKINNVKNGPNLNIISGLG